MGRLASSLFLSFISIFAQADVQSDLLLSKTSPVDEIYDEIDRIEIEGGSYAPEMGELWLALGQALKQQQDFEEAIDVVVRGMHVDKVNQGIQSNSQAIYLKELAELEHLRGDAESAAKFTRKVFDLYTNTMADNKPRLLEETLALRSLHLDLYKSAENKKYNSPHITAAYFYSLEAAFIAEKHLKEQPSLQRKAYRDLAQVSYKVARELSRQPPTHYGNARSNMRFSTGSASDMSAQEQDQWLATAYKTGRQAPAPDEYFGEAAPIAMTITEEPINAVPARFSIEVTRSGTVKSAEIIEAGEGLDEKSRKSLLDRVKSLVFRPKLSNGRPVSTTKLEYSFPVNNP